ncbi:MAG TPA: LLM class flavin-dependent oxidoreductase [Baekduia sp.]|uniref:LLM class flavin-dependent oxidoreductase n=1 Tax=Baekduia sp. TaxID=2600305 RepID=UPI002D77F076|nr:LLM class flavin-dependent oxidoreductase [Baekduia sp.]HET6509016.1 LLM class flavin-dependent oxidoreductase [Baekduia sp.]
MDIAVGVPSHVPGARSRDLLAWARRAEELGFSSLVITDRFAYDQLEPLAVAAALGAVTSRIGLRLSVVLVPNRGSAGQLAKQLATVQVLADGRLVAGVGVGDREIDYRLAGTEHRGRHARLEAMLDEMLAVWSGADAERAAIGPRPAGGQLPLMIGGSGEPTWRRVARYADGWTMAVGRPEDFAAGAGAVREAWSAAGRGGRPLLTAQRYFGLGAANVAAAEGFLRDYFAFLGPATELVVRSAPTDEEAVTAAVTAFAAAGADELAFLPTSAGLDQLEALAELLLI